MATAAPPRQPVAARRHYALSAALTLRATREAHKALRRGLDAVARVVTTHQVAQVQLSEHAVSLMLVEQQIEAEAQAILQALAFTTPPDSTAAMVASLDDPNGWEFDRLVTTLVQDAGRAAEQVSVAVRPRLGWVRHVSPPCCDRCAVLAGRVYRFSEGFQRHPGCDCTMTPVSQGDTSLVTTPADLLERGQVTGLSKADKKALDLGADLGKVVNVRLKKAGLTEAGQVLARRGVPTPAGVLRMAAGDQARAVELLKRFGYIR